MITTHLLRDTGIESLEGLQLPDDGTPSWVEVVSPDENELSELGEQVGLHKISLRAVNRAGHPPKFEEYEQGITLIVHTPIADSKGRARKVAIFLGKDTVVTILRRPLATVQHTMKRIREKHAAELTRPGLVPYLLLDEMTAGFEGLSDSMFDRLEQIEDAMELDIGSAVMDRILKYRHELLDLVRVVRRQRDVVDAFSRSTHPVIEDPLKPYFRESAYYLNRVRESLESSREGVMALRDGYLALVNNRLSETMRVLTVIATLMMPLSLIAGVYGMNVGGLPGADSKTGFWVVCGIMALLAILMLGWFRKKRWI